MTPAGKPAGSGTARMDASKAAQMEELIKKEQRCAAVICAAVIIGFVRGAAGQLCGLQDPGKS